MIGQVIDNKYRILDQIGEDFLADVYLVRDQVQNRMAILKVIHSRISTPDEFVERFGREAEKLGQLISPQALKVLDCGQVEAGPYAVFEYVGEKTLAALIQAEGRLSSKRALDIARQVGLCLVDAHAHQLVHRDLRPASLLLVDDETIKIMDFGLAWAVDLGRLISGGKLERDEYHAPELAIGENEDARADVYSLGGMLFEMLTGKRPVIRDDLSSAERRPSLLEPDLPPEADDLVARCLAPDPKDRPQSAAEFLEGIEDTLRAMAIAAGSPAMGMEDALAGHTLGAYRMIEKLGRGGMATVYKAYEPSLDRYVAIKVLPQHFAHDPAFMARFRREAKAIARLTHPNIVPVHGFGEEGALTYIAMRYVQAGTLKDLLGQPMTSERAGGIISQVARALSYAHQQGVIHRDVKPANVLMAEGEWPLLSDFGLARIVTSSMQLTQTGVGVGTPAYMSPEQGQGLKVDGRSDIYSLGIMLYEMLTGTVPFQADTPLAVVLKHITAPLPPPRRVNPNIPETMERIILKATAKDAAHRYQTADEMTEALEKALAGLPVEAPPTTIPAQEAMTAAMTAAPPPSALTELDTPPSADIPAATQVLPTPKRKLPVPVLALSLAGVLVAVALITGLALSGLIRLGPAITPSSTQIPATLVPETSPSPANIPTPTLAASASPAPPKPVSLGSPPLRAMEAKPCAWDDLGSGLCISPLSGGTPTKILEHADLELSSSPSWSPDGRQIAFSALKQGGDHSSENRIYIINADGSDLTELSPIGNDISPAWSPDGEWLAFHSSGNLAIMHPDGSDPDWVWYSEGQQCTDLPQWSPDGERIVASMQLGGCEWRFPMTREVWVISRDGTTVNTLATITHQDDSNYCTPVAFSPDGAQVAYFDADCQPWIVNADGSDRAAPLGEFPYWWTSAIHPQWGLEKEAIPSPPAHPEGKAAQVGEGLTVSLVETTPLYPPGERFRLDTGDELQTQSQDPLDVFFGHPVGFRGPDSDGALPQVRYQLTFDQEVELSEVTMEAAATFNAYIRLYDHQGREIVSTGPLDYGNVIHSETLPAPNPRGTRFFLEIQSEPGGWFCITNLSVQAQPTTGLPAPETVSLGEGLTVSLVETVPLYPAGERFGLDTGDDLQSQSQDPVDVFFGHPVGFRGPESGGALPRVRYQLTFDQEVELSQVVMEAAATGNAFMRLYDHQGKEIVSKGPFGQGNVIHTETLFAPNPRGTEFFLEIESDMTHWFCIIDLSVQARPTAGLPPPGTALVGEGLTVSLVETTPLYPTGERFALDTGDDLQSQSQDPVDVFFGHPVGFRGPESGGALPRVRYQLTFDQEVELSQVVMEAAATDNAFMRLYDHQGKEIVSKGPFGQGNVIHTETLFAPDPRGTEFFLEIESDMTHWFCIIDLSVQARPTAGLPPPGTALVGEGLTVSLVETTPLYPAGERFGLDTGDDLQSQSQDPVDVFFGQPVGFRGPESGGALPRVRYQLTFDQEVELSQVTMEAAATFNAYMRLYDDQGREIVSTGPLDYGNVIHSETLLTPNPRGTKFFLEIQSEPGNWFCITNLSVQAQPTASALNGGQDHSIVS